MVQDTKRRIDEYKAMLPGVKERVAAVALMLVMSIVMMASASYAWVTISRAPEVKGMSTTLAGNGNLEIALVNPQGTAPGDATGAEGSLLSSNITWGNLINLSDSGYGLDQIALRPALLSGYNRNNTPLYGASYDESGRVTSTSQTYSYATWKQAEDGSWYFDAAAPTYGVRAIASVTYKNISGNAAANKLKQNAKDAYVSAREMYFWLINNETLISSPGIFPEVKSMDALAALLKVYVQDQADYFTARLNDTTASYVTADYSGVVTYTYKLALEFQKVLEKEGEALLHMANLQAYLNGAETTASFASIDSLLADYKAGKLADKGVQLDSLATFSQDYSEIAKAVNGLKPYAEACDPNKVANPEKVEWRNIGTYVNYLVDISSTTIAKTRSSTAFTIGSIQSIGSSDLDIAMELLGILQDCQSPGKAADVVVYKGIISRLEQRLPEDELKTLEGNGTVVAIPLNVYAKILFIEVDIKEDKPVYATIRTTAATPYTSNNDLAYSESLESSGNKGDAVANDTYGMAIDMWVRTNVSDVVLTLEGSLVTEMQPEYGVDQKGNKVPLYLVSVEGNETTAYFMVDDEGVGGWYVASGHTLMGTAEEICGLDADGKPINVQEGYTIEAKMVEVVIGYDGVNRVWEDYLDLIEAGLMAENNTTQGAGSCYVFYADPSEQTRILHLLEAFTVVFLDSEGTTLGAAKLDTEHYYTINGKTTVPLQMATGKTYYTDENGNQHLGIMPMTKNEATWVTAIIYLDGQRLTNADVLAVGEIEGSLNIQFGSSVSLNNMDDEKLRFEFRDITATATSGGANTTNSLQPISYKYDGEAKEVTVTLLVDGEQPRSISAFFIRSISKNQGTRGETVEFTPNGDNTWSATFSLTKPGTYSLRNLIVDGADYALHDGTDSEDDVDNYPTIIIEGLGVTSVYCMLPQGVTMTADTSIAAEVQVSIDATGDLMPKQVRALFRGDDGTEFSGTLHYNETYKNWSGFANITESGTYTLEYLVIDGQYTEIDEEMQTNHVIYLGLTAQIWSDGVEQDDGSYSTTFEYRGETTVNVQMKLYDRSGEELKDLNDVSLYYSVEGGALDQDGIFDKLEWNSSTGYYEGNLTIKNGGVYVFDRVVTKTTTGNTSTIRKASVAPVFTAVITDPPEYIGNPTPTYQFVPNGNATITITMANAQTATMWAVIKNTTTNEEYLVKLGDGDKSVVDPEENIYNFIFKIPNTVATANGEKDVTLDGTWQLLTLYMQGVKNDKEEWIPKVSGDDVVPTATNSYVMNLSSKSIETTVAKSVNINITYENTYTNDAGETVTETGPFVGESFSGGFLEQFETDKVIITFTDFEGNPITVVDKVVWNLSYDIGTDTVYGKYDGTSSDPTAYQNTINADPENNTGVFVVPAQILNYAGEYTLTASYYLGDQATAINTGVKLGKDKTAQVVYTVTTSSPKVTISGVSSNVSSDRYYTTATPSSKNGMLTGSYNNMIYETGITDCYSAVVYMYVSAQSGTLDQEQVTIKYPSVTLSLDGVPTTHGGITMVFPGANNASSTFKFASGSKTATSTIGSGTSGVFNEGILGFGSGVDTWPVFYPAGKQTVSQIQVTYGTAVLTADLAHSVTINNPMHPPYVDFSSTANGQTLPTTPSRIFGTPMADGTFQITLPGSQTWTEAKSSTSNQDFVVQSGYPTTRNVYTERSQTSGCTTTTYYTPYIETTTVSKASSSTTTWTRTWTITGWKVGNTTYQPGETIVISGSQTITAVLGYTDGTKTTVSSTTTRTVIAYTPNGSETTTKPSGSKVTSVAGSTTDVVD